MQAGIRKLIFIMPFLFGIGFLAPLIAQVMTLLSAPAPFGMGHTAFGLVIGGGLGLAANIRGRWL